MDFAGLTHPWRRLAARRLRGVGPSRLDPLPEVVDGGAALRTYMEARGHRLEIVEASRTSCTVRIAIGPLGSRPVPVTVAAGAVEAAGCGGHPAWIADPRRFLEAAATRVAAKKVLADVAFVADETRPVLWTSGAAGAGAGRSAAPRRPRAAANPFTRRPLAGCATRRAPRGPIPGAPLERAIAAVPQARVVSGSSHVPSCGGRRGSRMPEGEA